jgi:hypothetical protein
MIPLTNRAGDLAEVDFFAVLIDVAGVRRKASLFLLRLMYSGRDFGWIYERQDQISFLDGHVRGFAHLGVPARVAYENLRLAVRRILVGGERLLTARCMALASHYLIEPCFLSAGGRARQGRRRSARQGKARPVACSYSERTRPTQQEPGSLETETAK